MTPSKNGNGIRLSVWIISVIIGFCLAVSVFLYSQNRAYASEIKYDIQKSIDIRLQTILEDIKEIKSDLKALK